MRLFLALTLLWPLVTPNAAWAQVAIPSTQPSAATQINQPVALQAKNLVVFPFRPFNNTVRFGWIGNALQETTLASMTGIAGIQPVILPAKAVTPADDLAAVAAGWHAGASLVVYGTYQIMDPDIRIIAKMIDVNTGRIVGTMRATGPILDLFNLEEALGQQGYQLAALESPVQPQPLTAPSTQPAATTQPAPAQAVPLPPGQAQPEPSTVTPGYTYVSPESLNNPYTYPPVADNGLTYGVSPFTTYDTYNPYWNPWWSYDYSYGPYGWDWWGFPSFIYVPYNANNHGLNHDHDRFDHGSHGGFNGRTAGNGQAVTHQFSFQSGGQQTSINGAFTTRGNALTSSFYSRPSFGGSYGSFIRMGGSRPEPGSGFYYNGASRSGYGNSFNSYSSSRYYSSFGRGFSEPSFSGSYSGYHGYSNAGVSHSFSSGSMGGGHH